MRTSKDTYKNGKLWNGYNYDTQQWTVNGVGYETAILAHEAIKNLKKLI